MADIRINALATTAASTASDDFVAVDGSANGTRKLNAYSPTFGGNLTVSGTTMTLSGSTFGIDMGAKGSANNPFFDFNSSGNNNDFDVRLQAKGGGVGSALGTLTLHATTAATASNAGAFIIGDSGTGTPTAGTAVAIGSGKIFTGSDVSVGGNLTVSGGTITGGASGMSLASGGTNQNISITPSGTGRVHIAKSAGQDSYIELAGNGNTAGTSSVVIGQSGADLGVLYNRKNAALSFGTNGTEVARFFANGNLFVGASPVDGGQKLQVSGTAAVVSSGTDQRTFLATNSAGSAEFGVFGNGKGYIGTTTNDNFEFYTNNTLGLTLDSSQNATFAGTARINGGVAYLASNSDIDLQFTKANLDKRWRFVVTGTESGSNAGSNMNFYTYSDAGAFLGTPLSINRSTGDATFAGTVTVSGAGVSTMSASSATEVGLKLRNTNAGTGAYSVFGMGNNADANRFNIITFSDNYTTSGVNAAGVTRINNNGTNKGINLVAGGAGGAVKVYAGAETDAALVATFDSSQNATFAGFVGIKDGMTAPSATSGTAKIYVDTADGDLKVIFGDGTIKTIATDT